MGASEATPAGRVLPPLSKRALDEGSNLRSTAMEGRSVVYGMMTGYGDSLWGLVKRFPSAEAHFKGGSQQGSRIFYKWARGEAAPRWTHVYYCGRRLLLDILGAELPAVRCRVQHIVWAAADTSLTLHEEDALNALQALPDRAQSSFLRGRTPVVRVKKETIATAVGEAKNDLERADLAAALLLWARWPMFQSFRSSSAEAMRIAQETLEVTAPVIRAFVASSWFCPEDAELAFNSLARARDKPFLYNRDKFDPLGTNPGFSNLQPRMGLDLLINRRPPRRRRLPSPSRSKTSRALSGP